MPYLNKNLRYSNIRICFNWLLFCIVGVILASCSSHSVRTGLSPFLQSKHKTEKIKDEGSAESPAGLSKFTTQQNENNNLQNEIVETNQGQVQLISLNKQLQSIEKNHNSLNDKVNTIQNDVSELKQSVEEIKDAIRFYHEGKKDVAIAGPEDLTAKSIEETFLENDGDDFIILPDEALKKKSTLKNHSLKQKRRKISKSGSVKSQQKPNNTKEKVNLSPSNNTTKNEYALSSDIREALRYFTRKNYHKAISRLIEIVNIEKDPVVKSDCNYWLGESHFGLKHFDKAVIFFIKVVEDVDTPKKDDAQIMIAESHIRRGKIESAKEAFAVLVNKFPDSEYLPRARKMLQQL